MYRRVRGRWRYRDRCENVKRNFSGGFTRVEKKRKRENTFFHKRAKTFPRDPLSLFPPRVPHVYRFTKNEGVAKDSQGRKHGGASTRLRKKEMKFFFDLDASFILARFFLHRTMSSSLLSLSLSVLFLPLSWL